MDQQFKEDRQMVPWLKISKYLSKVKIFLVPILSLSPFCPRTSKRLSMGEAVGTMQFRVQGEQIKMMKEKRKNEYKEKKKDKEKICMRKEKIYMSL
jgi:hypothetical protein